MRSQKGFTLIELVIVVVILGILGAMSSTLLLEGFKAFFTSEEIAEANTQGQTASQRMTRDIRTVRSSADITTASASQFSFTNFDGDTISYSLSSNNLILTLNGNAQTLASGVNSLAFNYYDKNGISTATINLIDYVKFSLNITKNNANYTLTNTIYLRNLT